MGLVYCQRQLGLVIVTAAAVDDRFVVKIALLPSLNTDSLVVSFFASECHKLLSSGLPLWQYVGKHLDTETLPGERCAGTLVAF